MTRFQKLAVAALVSVLLLMFVGAIVRVTGSGMGCPDWPTCWGCLIPPTSVDQVDFDKLPIEKFQRKAERMGRDPRRSLRRPCVRSSIRAMCGRSSSTACSVCRWDFSRWRRSSPHSGRREKRPLVFWMAFGSLVVVLVNAWMGARVVYSGLKPGVLTTHLALAMLLTGMLAYCAWRGTDTPWRVRMASRLRWRN